jgi:hypothetical protein
VVVRLLGLRVNAHAVHVEDEEVVVASLGDERIDDGGESLILRRGFACLHVRHVVGDAVHADLAVLHPGDVGPHLVEDLLDGHALVAAGGGQSTGGGAAERIDDIDERAHLGLAVFEVALDLSLLHISDGDELVHRGGLEVLGGGPLHAGHAVAGTAVGEDARPDERHETTDHEREHELRADLHW